MALIDRTVIRKLRAYVSSRVKARFVRRFKPNFADSYFIGALTADETTLRDAKRALAEKDGARARELVALHFRRRSSPRFFVDKEEARKLALDMAAEKPLWRERTLRAAEEMVHDGLPVYTERAPPFGDDWDWSALKAGPGNDVLYPVRLHRFGFGPQLVLASLYGAPTIPVFDRLVAAWTEYAGKNDFAYISNTTVITRIISLSWSWLFLTAFNQDETRDLIDLEYRLIKMIHADAAFLSAREVRSIPNNHRIAYLFAKAYLALLFPEFSDLRDWMSAEIDGWTAELRHQTYPDGGGFEPTLHYHQISCETLAAYVLLCRRNDLALDPWLERRLESLLEFQTALAGPEVTPLRIGDASEHALFSLDVDEGWSSAGLRELYRVLFRPGLRPAPQSAPAVERAFWLAGGRLAAPVADECADAEPTFSSFPDSGYYVLGEAGLTSRLIFRTGPDKDRAVFGGHMHADLLSVYLTVDSRPFIVEAGTYTYRSNMSAWPANTPSRRKFFMGPESHNTISIDGEDPLGPIAADFRDVDVPARVEHTVSRQGGTVTWVEAKIINGGSYSDHRRGVVQVYGEYWAVYDVTGPGRAGKRASLGFQLAPEIEIAENAEQSLRLDANGTGLLIAWSDSLALAEVLVGTLAPLGGWVSTAYGKMEPAPFLRLDLKDGSELAACAFSATSKERRSLSVAAERVAKKSIGLRIAYGDVVDHLLVTDTGEPGELSGWGIAADAALVILRIIDGAPALLKAFDFKAVTFSEPEVDVSCGTRKDVLEIAL